jgi:hypothetical protein
MTADETSIDGLRVQAKLAGLELTDEELQELLPGVRRMREGAARIRQVLDPATEPASTFAAVQFAAGGGGDA